LRGAVAVDEGPGRDPDRQEGREFRPDQPSEAADPDDGAERPREMGAEQPDQYPLPERHERGRIPGKALHPTVLDEQALNLRSGRAATPLPHAHAKMRPSKQKQDGCHPQSDARREHDCGTSRNKDDAAIHSPQ